MSPPALAGVGHIAFRRDVTSVRAYVHMSQGHYSGTFHTRKLKFSMLLTHGKTFKFYVKLPRGHTPGWG